ncbi:hypothetical protein BEL05_12225 [Shewanella colwelliana]|uniref:Uncharacterized protein n=1 Tax=Shewanella colwelliana TaxID=23 RepID=A0A1E5IWQ2_SHECO|nr:hypothetical protein BEL05_12225 [Shewanella colwelliana]
MSIRLGAVHFTLARCPKVLGQISKADCNIKTEEIWEKDLLHKNQPHYEVYKNKKNYDKGKRDRAVWEDGRLTE